MMMKHLIFTFALVIMLPECTNDDDDQTTDKDFIIGQWNLSLNINNSAGGETIPDSNDTHFYILNNDGTFSRTSTKENTTNELIGEYIVSDSNPNYSNENSEIKLFIELTYDPDVKFFNCGQLPDHKQLLFLTSQNILKNEQEGVCDGNSFHYKKSNLSF